MRVSQVYRKPETRKIRPSLDVGYLLLVHFLPDPDVAGRRIRPHAFRREDGNLGQESDAEEHKADEVLDMEAEADLCTQGHEVRDDGEEPEKEKSRRGPIGPRMREMVQSASDEVRQEADAGGELCEMTSRSMTARGDGNDGR